MYRYRRILVGLRIDDRDEAVIRYASLVSRMAASEEVIFMHVTPTVDVVHDLRSRFPELGQSPSAFVRRQVEGAVSRHFDGADETRVRIRVAEGPVLLSLLRTAKEETVDLVIAGKDQDGLLAEKLARKAPSSVLVVPPDASGTVEHVLAPVDFSPRARDAVDVAVAFSEAAGLDGFQVLHVYDVPQGYYKAGKSLDEFAQIVRCQAQQRMEEFLAECDLRGLHAEPLFRHHADPAQAIQETVAENGVDLVVMGARGRTDGAAILLGSLAERMVRTHDVPIVAVKRKGETLSFLDALLNL